MIAAVCAGSDSRTSFGPCLISRCSAPTCGVEALAVQPGHHLRGQQGRRRRRRQKCAVRRCAAAAADGCRLHSSWRSAAPHAARVSRSGAIALTALSECSSVEPESVGESMTVLNGPGAWRQQQDRFSKRARSRRGSVQSSRDRRGAYSAPKRSRGAQMRSARVRQARSQGRGLHRAPVRNARSMELGLSMGLNWLPLRGLAFTIQLLRTFRQT